MGYNGIYLVTKKLSAISSTDMEILKKEDRTFFPVGYPGFIRKYGTGIINDFLLILSPSRIQTELSSSIERYCQDRWQWDNVEIPQGKRKNLVKIGSTIDGDDLVYSPDFQTANFVFPRHSQVVYTTGPSLEDCLDWVFCSEVITTRYKTLFFKPFDDKRPSLTLSMQSCHTLVKPEVKSLFKARVGGITHVYDDDLDCFNQSFGAHLHLNVSEEDEITQIDMDFDKERASDFLDALCPSLYEIGFEIKYKKNVD